MKHPSDSSPTILPASKRQDVSKSPPRVNISYVGAFGKPRPSLPKPQATLAEPAAPIMPKSESVPIPQVNISYVGVFGKPRPSMPGLASTSMVSIGQSGAFGKQHSTGGSATSPREPIINEPQSTGSRGHEKDMSDQKPAETPCQGSFSDTNLQPKQDKQTQADASITTDCSSRKCANGHINDDPSCESSHLSIEFESSAKALTGVTSMSGASNTLAEESPCPRPTDTDHHDWNSPAFDYGTHSDSKDAEDAGESDLDMADADEEDDLDSDVVDTDADADADSETEVITRHTRSAFEKAKRRFLRQQSRGLHVFADPIVRIFDKFEIKGTLTQTNTPMTKLDFFTFCIGRLSLRDIVPLALYRDDERSWFEDATVDFLVDAAPAYQSSPNIPDIAYVNSGFSDIYFKENASTIDASTGQARRYSIAEVNHALNAEIAHVAATHTVKDMPWPFPAGLVGLRKIVMACNSACHWYSVVLEYDRSNSSCSIRLYGSSSRPDVLRTMKQHLPLLARLLALSPAVAIPNLQAVHQIEVMKCIQQMNSIDCGPFTVRAITYEMRDRRVPFRDSRLIEYGRRLRHLYLGWAYGAIIGSTMPETFEVEDGGEVSEEDSDDDNCDHHESPISPQKAADLVRQQYDLASTNRGINQEMIDILTEVIALGITQKQALPMLVDHMLLYAPSRWYSETVIDA